MLHYCVAVFLLIVLLIYFCFLGDRLLRIIDKPRELTFQLLLGAFAFFALFNVGYILCLFLKRNLIALSIVELVVFTGVSFWGIASGFTPSKGIHHFVEYFRTYKRYCSILLFISIVLFYYAVRFTYPGWDATYYIKEISRAVEHGTMYQDWTAQHLGNPLKLKYALCAYYMFLAVLAKYTAVPAVIIAKIIGGGLCVVLSIDVIYCLGKELFKNEKDALCVTVLWELLNTAFISIYTSSAFLMERSYEGKAWCANVIIPGLLLLFYHLYIYEEEIYWTYIMIVVLACNAISMSTLLIAPIMVTVFSSIIFLDRPQLRVIRKWIICMLPLSLYCLFIFLEAKGLYRLMI